MRNAETNRPRQRSGRSWRIANPVEQTRTMGEGRAVRGNDRQTLDPIFGLGARNWVFVWQFVERYLVRPRPVLEQLLLPPAI